ncbi:hypothetical protein JQN72_01075 [Phycicoccus sp. CSK15P-2]|uniref:hypothetical protein n=1 Tax=Phycicoccus sp. CSK15P-2 TaxID=2807627 RepID=UPI001952A07B|nr:hypothetical protein [Phycicoccus sp. CSK15P-2]MBM6402837.1 hypothetical protein [Phycicoccus sp. CSK15P-2]
MTTTTKRRSAALALAGGAAAVASTVAAPAASADPTDITNNCDLRVTVDEIKDSGYADDNIIVFREDRMSSFRFGAVERSGRIVAHGCQENDNRVYLWYAFSGDGEFVRKGDGGYRNWAFYGLWDRPEDNRVVFHPF